MRTTLAIDDGLLRAAKRQARERGLTLGQLVEEALRAELAGYRNDRERPPIPIFHDGTGLRPGINASSNTSLYEALDEGQAVEQLR